MKNIQLGPKSKLWVLMILFIVVAWCGLGIYLRYEVKVNRAKLEQERIETSRRNEFLRRGATYQQDLEQRTGGSRVRNALDGR